MLFYFVIGKKIARKLNPVQKDAIYGCQVVRGKKLKFFECNFVAILHSRKINTFLETKMDFFGK